MGEPRFSCRDCGRRWNALGEVHCAVCHLHFSGYEGFDLHLRERGESVLHLDPTTYQRPKAGGALFSGLPTPYGTIWQRARAS